MGDFPFGLGTFLVPGPQFSVMSYGADPAGVKDSTAAFAAAYAAAAATLTGSSIPGAYVTIPAGTFKVTAGHCVAADRRIGLLGAGAAICQVNASGSGDLFTHHEANWSPAGGGSQGLSIGGFTMDGTSTTGATNGLKLYDLCSTMVHDIIAQNFTQAGSAGLYFTSALGWTERLLFLRARTNNCAIGTRFAGNFAGQGGTSFDYMRCLDLYADIFPGQIGVQLDGFAQLDQATFFYSYNANSQAAGADSTALMIGPTDPNTETSRIINSLFDIRGEKDGSGSNCFDLHIGAWANLTGTGVLLGSGMDAGAVNSGSVYVSGYINTAAFPATGQFFGLPGGGGVPSFGGFTKLFPLPPTMKGMQLIDWLASSQAVRGTLIGGTGNPNGGSYFSNLAGDLFWRQDGANAPNSQLYVTNANGSNVWQPVVAAAVRSGTVTLVAGSSGAITDTSITANSVIRTFNRAAGGTVGALSVTLSAGASFTIHSTSGTDTSSVGWEIVSY